LFKKLSTFLRNIDNSAKRSKQETYKLQARIYDLENHASNQNSRISALESRVDDVESRIGKLEYEVDTILKTIRVNKSTSDEEIQNMISRLKDVAAILVSNRNKEKSKEGIDRIKKLEKKVMTRTKTIEKRAA
jgi:uncharacterized coiled-coil protein SlyX